MSAMTCVAERLSSDQEIERIARMTGLYFLWSEQTMQSKNITSAHLHITGENRIGERRGDSGQIDGIN